MPITIQSPVGFSLNVPAVVLMSILDQHLRRPEGSDRAIGLLFGQKSLESSVQINILSTVAIPLSENGHQVRNIYIYIIVICVWPV